MHYAMVLKISIMKLQTEIMKADSSAHHAMSILPIVKDSLHSLIFSCVVPSLRTVRQVLKNMTNLSLFDKKRQVNMYRYACYNHCLRSKYISHMLPQNCT